jgi:hypothetical protein
MKETAYTKGQKVNSPEGPGEVTEVIGDKVVVKLDNGETKTFPSGDVADESNAG